jgi:hypothetical protein
MLHYGRATANITSSSALPKLRAFVLRPEVPKSAQI